VLPAFTGIGGPVYLAGALLLNARLLSAAWRLWRRDAASAAADRHKAEKRFFGFSIFYLFLHFALFLAEAAMRAADLTPVVWPVLF
jgi:heme o synthase